jgi:hypothetical protein
MRYARFKKEDKTVEGIAQRLFRLKGKGSQAAMKKAAQSLLETNPQLADLNKLPNGALIKVPDDTPEIQPAERVAPPLPNGSPLLGRVAGALAAIEQSASDAEARLSSILQASSESLRSLTIPGEFKNLLKQLPEQQLQAVELPDTKAMLAEIRQCLDQLSAAKTARESAIVELRASLGISPPEDTASHQ